MSISSSSSYRSRDRSHDRSRRHRSHRRRSPNDRRRYKTDRSRGHKRHSRRSEERELERRREEREVDYGNPTCTIMLRQLPLFVTEKHIMEEMINEQIPATDIRLVTKKETGSSRGFAFIEFKSSEESQEWIRKCKAMWLFMGRYDLPMSFCESKPQVSYNHEEIIPQDWTCTKCNTYNFKKRSFCFRCNISREESFAEVELNQVGSSPCNTLILRGLDTLTDENSVISNLSKWTKTPLENLHIMRDRETQRSKGFAFIEFSSVDESRKVLDELCFGTKVLEIDGKQILIDFARTSYNAIMTAMENWPQKPTPPVSNVYQADTSNAGAAVAQAAMNKGKGQKKSTANQNQSSTYVYDESSGYYYDTASGLYYDPTSNYFYNPMTAQYLYWNGTSFVPHVPQQPEAEKKPEKKAEPKPQSAEVKAARKIKRDMDKWVSAQNSSRSKQDLIPNEENTTQFVLPVESQNAETAENLVNWTRLVCLLCKRQFTSREVLEKHVRMSQMHAKNLEAVNKPRETAQVSDESSFVDISIDTSQRQYRDRAQERRDKYGISEPPTDLL